MDRKKVKIRHKSRYVGAMVAIYFIVSAIEMVAEYFRDAYLVYLTKPLIIPILILIYWSTSTRRDYIYIAALIFSWIANIFFISSAFHSIFTGAMFYFVFRILTIHIVIKHTKLPSAFPMIVGCIPFLFIYLYLINLTHETIGDGLPIFIGQCILISFLGGISVGNYILRSNKANTFLLISTMFFAATQFLFVIRVIYSSIQIIQPLSMALFVFAQFLYYRFIILAEKKKAGYQIINDTPPNHP